MFNELNFLQQEIKTNGGKLVKSKLKHIIQVCYIYYAYCTILSISKIIPRDSGRIINEDIYNLAALLTYPKMLNYFRNLGPNMLCPPLPSQFPLKWLPSWLASFSPSFIWNSCWEYNLKLVTGQGIWAGMETWSPDAGQGSHSREA